MARVALRMTQRDVAEAADVAQTQVSSLERECYVIPSAQGRILAILGIDDGEVLE